MKRAILIVLLIVVATFYILEQYVLIGQRLVNATANISEQNPRPAVQIPVMSDGDDVTVYMKADDISVSYTVVDPEERIVEEHQVALGRHDFSFAAPQRGTYLLVLESPDGQGVVTMSAWANDSRLFYGIYF